MATTAADPVFVDTNILVFANTATTPLQASARARPQSFAASGPELWISRQILREYLATTPRTQSCTMPVPAATLVADVGRFQAQFRIAGDGPAVTANLLGLLATTPVGGEQAHGLRRLLTHNTSDFARFTAPIRVEPLVTSP